MEEKLSINEALRLGVAYHQKGELKKAEAIYRVILIKDPNNADANHNLGVLCGQTGKLLLALPFFEKALQINPRSYQYSKSLEQTKENINKKVYTAKNSKLNRKIKKLFQQEKYETAISLAREESKKNPDYANILGNLGNLFKDKEKFNEARLCYLEALKTNKHLTEIYYNLASLLTHLGHYEKAKIYYSKTIKLNPNYVVAYNDMGHVTNKLGEIDKAKGYFVRAIVLDPHYFMAYYNLAFLLKESGDLKNAEAYYRKALEIKPNDIKAHRYLAELTKYTKDTPHLKELHKVYENVESDEDKYYLDFALGKAYEDIKNYKKSFQFLEKGNALRFKELNYDIQTDIKMFNTLQNLFNGNIRKEKIQYSQQQEKRAIFILGMPRSGTTLTEQILSSHQEVQPCGELPYMDSEVKRNILSQHENNSFSLEDALSLVGENYMRSVEKLQFNEKVFTDKMPHNFRYVGAILESFPDAKIIHTKRDPMAICWSMYKTFFPNEELSYCFNFETLGTFYRMYKVMMEFWHEKYPGRIYDLNYELLTENQEEETKKLLAFCELSWDEAVLEPHKNKRTVSTASFQQVRKKVYTGSSQAWKKFNKHLLPLQEELAKDDNPLI